MTTLPGNSKYELEDGLVTRLWDSKGHLWIEAKVQNGVLLEACFTLPGGGQGILRTRSGEDPVLGKVDGFYLPDGSEPIALVQSIDWREPEYIPAVDRPAALPSGLGAAVLNYLGLQASLGGDKPLRYRGPYATGKLFDSLHRSFHLGDRDPADAWDTFHRGVEKSALHNEFVSPAVDFFPAPFEWVAHNGEVCAELRGGLQRLMIQGRAYEVDENSSRQLIAHEDGFHAAVVLGGEVWTTRMQVGGQGEPLSSLEPIPDLTGPMMGRAIEEPLRKVLAGALAGRAPEFLREALQLVILRAPICWGNAGDEPCSFESGSLILHAGLAEPMATQTPDRVLTTLAYALEPVATKVAREVLESLKRREDSTKEPSGLA